MTRLALCLPLLATSVSEALTRNTHNNKYALQSIFRNL